MKKFLNILGSTVNAALVGILAGQVFEGGITNFYWWVCIGIAVLANALQSLRSRETVPTPVPVDTVKE